MNEYMRTVEINGVKFEIDTRTAKKIDTYKVGDPVKILIKTYSGYASHPGCIVGIDAFKNLPTIVVAYIDGVLSSTGDMKFAYLNSQSEGVEICPMHQEDIIPNKDTVLTMFNRSIGNKQAEIRSIEEKRDYFLRQFGTAFGVGKTEVAKATAPAASNP